MTCVESEGRNSEQRNDLQLDDQAAQLETPASAPREPDVAEYVQDSLASLTPMPVQNDLFSVDTSMDAFGFPDFFGHIMMPDMVDCGPVTEAMMPPDVSNFTQDVNLDALDFDFTFLASGLTRPSTAQGFRDEPPQTGNQAPTPQSDVQLRSEAFENSPWSWNHWIPPRNHHAFTGQEELNVREDRVSSSHQHVSPNVERAAHCDLDVDARDRMIRVVTQVASSRLAIPSFPSLQLLEDLIDVFLLQDGNAIDSIVHAPTFSSQKTKTELLLAMVAGGSKYIALEPVWKMGLVIQEVVRLAVADVFESDNSTTRAIELQQAYLLWLDVGAWSGFRRKTEIANSFVQPLTTMLTWSHSFTKFRYKDFAPLASDSDDAVNAKWRSWLDQEARKRLVLRVFLQESRCALANVQTPLLSPAQLMLPLPASLGLWRAPNAHAWRNTYLMEQPPSQQSIPSVMETFGDISALDSMASYVDKSLCLLTACHALAHEVWHFRQEAKLLSNWHSQGRRDRWLAHVNRQRGILDNLTSLSAYCDMDENTSSEILFTIEFLTMSLHVSMEDIQAFSGKLGEQEARKAFPILRAWSEDAESRVAVWHAGQVFKVARTFEKTKLRDFYAVALYQATLTLWVYGMVTSNAARKSGEKTPTQVGRKSTTTNGSLDSGFCQGSRVYLDDSKDKTAKSFKLLGQGVPGVRSVAWENADPQSWNARDDFCPLQSSKRLMKVAGDLLRDNFPGSQNGLPPLVNNLANLMNDLGKLSGK